ncbi:MAG: PQQ-binding-like beta-propeller repeat protein [Pseudomonadota bacterium]
MVQRLSSIVFLFAVVSLGCGDGKLAGDASDDTAADDGTDTQADPDAADDPDSVEEVSDPAADDTAGDPDAAGDAIDAGDVEEEEETPQTCPSGGWGDILYQFTADGAIASTPAVGGEGTVTFGTQNAKLYAVDCHGEQEWDWPYECMDWCPQAFEGSPAIGEDGTIYIGDDVAVPNYAFAITPEGDVDWFYETYSVYSQMDASPVIMNDGTIVFGSHGDSGYVGPIGMIIALDPEGAVLDGFPLNTKAIRGSPAADGDVLYVGETGRKGGTESINVVFGVMADAETTWRTELTSIAGFGPLSLSSLAIDRDGSVVVVENFNAFDEVVDHCTLVLLGSGTGSIDRRIPLSTESLSVGSPVVGLADFGEDVIVALGNGRLVSANPFSGGVVITFDIDLGSSCAGAPLLADDGNIYAAAGNNVFRISKSGTYSSETDVVEVPGTISTSLAMGPDGILYMGTTEGKLIALATDAGGLDATAPWPCYRHDGFNTGNQDTVIRD